MSGSEGIEGRPTGYRGALRAYLRQIAKYKLLSRSGEFRLAQSSQEGDEEARRRLVEGNLRLVVKIALEYRTASLRLEDMISEGNIGLIEAAKRFDPDRGVRFVSYAAWWVRKYVVTALHDASKASSMPLAPGPMRRPDGSPGPRGKILSLEDFLHNSGKRMIVDEVPQPGEGPDETVLAHDLQQAMISVLDRLPERFRRILEMHYGLDGEPPRTLQEIGNALGFTREHVRQLEIQALDRARRLLSG